MNEILNVAVWWEMVFLVRGNLYNMIDFLLSRSRLRASPILGTMPILGCNAESGNMGKWMMRRIVTLRRVTKLYTVVETLQNMESRTDSQ